MTSTVLTLIYATSSVSLLSALWYSLYVLLKTKLNLEGEYTTRIVAAFHAVVCVILSYSSLSKEVDPLVTPGEPNTHLQTITMMLSVGYFVYDFIWCVKYQPEPRIILVHHLSSIFSMFYITVYGRSGAEAIAGLGCMELTNPLLQARWFLKFHKKKNTLAYWIVEYSFFGLFLYVRLVYGTQLVLATVQSDKTNIVVKFITLLLYVISLAFIYNIMMIVTKRLQRNRTHPALSFLHSNPPPTSSS